MRTEDNNFKNGIIIKLTGGFYYVEADDEIYECKARGSFRNKEQSPVVGDRVRIAVMEDGYHSIEEIYERNNLLVRPALSNLDLLIIVVSAAEPAPNTVIIDKLTAASVSLGITPVIVFSKTDLQNVDELSHIYSKAGFRTFLYSDGDKDSVNRIKSELSHKLIAFIGNSGVGKSTLINNLYPELSLETGQISKKLGRGRHTTRTVELFKTTDGYIADTPGFSTIDLERYNLWDKEKLMHYFPEFEDYLGQCMFTSCMHTCEKGCAVIDAVSRGDIPESRHTSYVEMYNEVKDIKPWQIKG